MIMTLEELACLERVCLERVGVLRTYSDATLEIYRKAGSSEVRRRAKEVVHSIEMTILDHYGLWHSLFDCQIEAKIAEAEVVEEK